MKIVLSNQYNIHAHAKSFLSPSLQVFISCFLFTSLPFLFECIFFPLLAVFFALPFAFSRSQERAVVASAEEMKTRRARLFEMWREAGTLKHRAATRSTPVHPPVSISSSLARVPQQQPQDEQASGENFLRALTGGLRRTESSPEDAAEEEHHSTSIFGGVVGDDGVTFLAAATAGAAAEESVLLDAEHGIRLMPLRNKNTNNDITTNTYVPTDNTNVDKRCETDVSGRSEQRTPGEGVGPTRDEGDVHVGYGSRVWRWLRRWL